MTYSIKWYYKAITNWNANDYAFYLHVYTLIIYIYKGIISKFGEEYTTVLSKSYTTTNAKVN